MSARTVQLTEDETAALAEVLAMLSVMEDRAIRPDGVLEVTRELWNDMLVRPAMRLRRLRLTAIAETVAKP